MTVAALFAGNFPDKAIRADAAIPAFGLDGLRLLVELTFNDFNGLDLVKSEYPFGSIVTPLGATPALPAMHIELAVVTNRNLMHIYKTRKAAFAGVFVVDQLDGAA